MEGRGEFEAANLQPWKGRTVRACELEEVYSGGLLRGT